MISAWRIDAFHRWDMTASDWLEALGYKRYPDGSWQAADGSEADLETALGEMIKQVEVQTEMQCPCVLLNPRTVGSLHCSLIAGHEGEHKTYFGAKWREGYE